MKPIIPISTLAEILGVTSQSIHQKLKRKKIQCPRTGKYSYIDHETSKKYFNLEFQKKKVATHIVKGGTGKSTTAHQISSCLNALGAKVLLIDCDHQANLTEYFGVEVPADSPVLIDLIENGYTAKEGIINICEGLDIFPSRMSNVMCDSHIVTNKKILKDKLFNIKFKEVEDDYDYIIVDCPPALNHLVTSIYLYIDFVLAPMLPDIGSLQAMDISLDELHSYKSDYDENIEIQFFLNKIKTQTILSQEIGGKLLSDERVKDKLLETYIAENQEIQNLTYDNKSLFSNLKKLQARNDFINLTLEAFKINLKG